jgi:hypothetical protein
VVARRIGARVTAPARRNRSVRLGPDGRESARDAQTRAILRRRREVRRRAGTFVAGERALREVVEEIVFDGAKPRGEILILDQALLERFGFIGREFAEQPAA